MIFGALPAASGTLGDYRQLVLNGHPLKWGPPMFGTGATVTYALATETMAFAGARNCGGLAPIGGLLAANRVGETVFAAEIAASFAQWQAAADIRFLPADPESADILIGAQTSPRGRAFTNVVYDQAASGAGPRQLKRSVICLNPLEHWKVGFDGDLSRYDLRYTLLHEIGHAIGLDHPAGRNAVMDFAYRERFRVLQAGDIAGVAALYGPLPAAVVAAGITEGRDEPPVVTR